jgi:hypothetical protein
MDAVPARIGRDPFRCPGGRGRGRARGPPRDLELLRQWIELNREALLAYWDGDLLTDEVIAKLKPVAPTPRPD